MQKFTVLVVDDDTEIKDAIEIYLKNEGIRVLKASNGIEALDIVNTEEIHLILMDIMMPKMDGIKATFTLRQDKNIPIIILSAKSEDTDKILGLNIGADDYITKPFNPLELIARVKSQLRRYITLGKYKNSDDEIVIRGLRLNKNSKLIYVEDQSFKVTPTEYKILELLMENSGKVYSIDEIYEKVWGESCFNGDNTVSVHIRRIREKIEVNPKDPKYLKVVWGIGYKIEK